MSNCSGNCEGCSSKGSCADEKKEPLMKGIQQAVLVLSGKGGVGKSTVASTLALALAGRGYKVGLLDVDFHGPSQPTLFNVTHLRMEGDAGGMLPLEIAGLKLVSIGLLLDENDKAIIWRGPVKMGVIKQLLEEVQWGELDYLVLDFPPGTGDESLSACQLIDCPKTAVVVTTPQEVALADCRKCVDFCNQLKVPVTGIVENMSGFVCPECGHRHELFSAGGGARLAALAGAPLLAQLPLDPEFLQRCDAGNLPQALSECRVIREEIEHVADRLC